MGFDVVDDVFAAKLSELAECEVQVGVCEEDAHGTVASKLGVLDGEVSRDLPEVCCGERWGADGADSEDLRVAFEGLFDQDVVGWGWQVAGCVPLADCSDGLPDVAVGQGSACFSETAAVCEEGDEVGDVFGWDREFGFEPELPSELFERFPVFAVRNLSALCLGVPCEFDSDVDEPLEPLVTVGVLAEPGVEAVS
ncbi:MAG: hypothetical protein IPH29_11955 [Candidatus Microthrix sp.]|nr:hypothetical protein [Candidatus Microthrix sp.]